MYAGGSEKSIDFFNKSFYMIHASRMISLLLYILLYLCGVRVNVHKSKKVIIKENK